MTLSLQGTLDTFTVADVLPVLERGSKTGALRVRGETGSGILHVVAGRLHGAESEALRGAVPSDDALRTRLLDVCFVLFREERGTFEFDDSWRPPAGSRLTGVDVDVVLAEVGRVVADWNAAGRGGLDFDARVTLVGELAGETVTLDRYAWRVVRAVGPASSLRDVAAVLGMSVVETAGALGALADEGILSVGGTGTGAVVDAFSSLHADRGFGSGPVTPAPFDPTAFDPATYDPAEHAPLEWSAQPGTSGHAEPDPVVRPAVDLDADLAALEAAARDLGAHAEADDWDPADPTGSRPDRTSAFARLASERTETELEEQAEAEAAARRAGFALAVGDLDLLPASGDRAADGLDPTYEPATYDPAAYELAADDPAGFDPDAYAPLTFDPPAAAPFVVDAPDAGSGYADLPVDDERRYLAPEVGALPAEATGFADPAAADPVDDADAPDADAPDPDAPDVHRIGEPKDRGALLRMFSALREG